RNCRSAVLRIFLPLVSSKGVVQEARSKSQRAHSSRPSTIEMGKKEPDSDLISCSDPAHSWLFSHDFSEFRFGKERDGFFPRVSCCLPEAVKILFLSKGERGRGEQSQRHRHF